MSDREQSQILEYVGMSSFPEPDGFMNNAFKKLENKRILFYQQLVNLFPLGKVYYPGSEADPIPLQIFGDRVVYGSLYESDYFRMVKDRELERPIDYEEQIGQTTNTDQLHAVYADVRKSPFPEKTFRIIIINRLRIQFDDKFVQEISRLLVDGGIIVYEDNTDIKILAQNAESFTNIGFTPHELDKTGGIDNITYWGYTRKLRVTDERGKIGLSRDQFLEELQRGNATEMRGHLFRVLKKKKTVKNSSNFL